MMSADVLHFDRVTSACSRKALFPWSSARRACILAPDVLEGQQREPRVRQISRRNIRAPCEPLQGPAALSPGSFVNRTRGPRLRHPEAAESPFLGGLDVGLGYAPLNFFVGRVPALVEKGLERLLVVVEQTTSLVPARVALVACSIGAGLRRRRQ